MDKRKLGTALDAQQSVEGKAEQPKAFLSLSAPYAQLGTYKFNFRYDFEKRPLLKPVSQTSYDLPGSKESLREYLKVRYHLGRLVRENNPRLAQEFRNVDFLSPFVYDLPEVTFAAATDSLKLDSEVLKRDSVEYYEGVRAAEQAEIASLVEYRDKLRYIITKGYSPDELEGLLEKALWQEAEPKEQDTEISALYGQSGHYLYNTPTQPESGVVSIENSGLSSLSETVQPREFVLTDLLSLPKLGDWFWYPFSVFMFALTISGLFSVRFHLAWVFAIPAGLICLTASLMSYTFDDAPDEQ